MDIKIFKSEFYELPVFLGSGLAICPVCGVGSNIYPCYEEGKGTAAPHRLTYCNHKLESKRVIKYG